MHTREGSSELFKGDGKRGEVVWMETEAHMTTYQLNLIHAIHAGVVKQLIIPLQGRHLVEPLDPKRIPCGVHNNCCWIVCPARWAD